MQPKVLHGEAYRGFVISYDPKPIPTRKFDWDFYHRDFDGSPDARDGRCGSVASIAEAKAEIDAFHATERGSDGFAKLYREAR